VGPRCTAGVSDCVCLQRTGPAACRSRASRTTVRLVRLALLRRLITLRPTAQVSRALQWATTSRWHELCMSSCMAQLLLMIT
jgi:hypothetical protein